MEETGQLHATAALLPDEATRVMWITNRL